MIYPDYTEFKLRNFLVSIFVPSLGTQNVGGVTTATPELLKGLASQVSVFRKQLSV